MDILHTNLAAIQQQLSFVATDPIDWKLYVQGFSWAVTLWETYLLIRQYPLYSRTAPPPELSAHLSAETFEKSQKYGKDKAQLGLFSKLYSQIVDSLMLQYGFYAWCWNVSGGWVDSFGYQGYEIVHSIAFSFLLYFVSSLPTLPVSLYSTFVVEQKHGFNNQTLTLFFTDLVKGWLVAFALGAPFLAVFLWIFDWAGDRFVPFIMLFMISFQLIMIVLYPTVIQPLFNKLTPLKPSEVRTRVETLSSSLSFPLKHLYEIDGSKRSSHSNAYFFGLPWSKHIVIFDTLLTQSTPGEVEAVLAHELGHWYFLHPTKMMAISQFHVFSILALFPAFLHAPPLLRSFGFSKVTSAKPPTIVAFLLFQMILSPVEAVVAMAMNALSRRFEWEADRFACDIGEIISKKQEGKENKVDVAGMKDMGTRLGNALITLHVKNLSTVHVDWLYSAYHHSHPTLIERLKALEELGKKKE